MFTYEIFCGGTYATGPIKEKKTKKYITKEDCHDSNFLKVELNILEETG